MALFGPFMLFVIKPFLETCFRTFLGTSFGPDLGLFYFGQWPSFSLFLAICFGPSGPDLGLS